MDRFDFKLKGKKERFLIVNDNRSADFKTCPPEVFLTKNYPNPDCVRFELPAHGARSLRGFAIHSARQTHDCALSSATKS